MLVFNKNELDTLNRIILSISEKNDSRQMRKDFLESLKTILKYDSSIFDLVKYNEDCFEFYDPVLINIDEKLFEKYNRELINVDYLQQIFYLSKPVIYKHTDFLNEDMRVRTLTYQEFILPLNVHYGTSCTFFYEDKMIATLTLYRAKEYGDFSEKELYYLHLLHPHLSNNLTKFSQKENPILLISDTNNLALKYNLTERESIVVTLLIQGLSDKEISEKMFISIHTIKKHIQNIYEKVGINSRIKLMNIFINTERGCREII